MLDERSPVKHSLVLHRRDPEQGVRRVYSLMIERDLFGSVRLVRNWGWIGTGASDGKLAPAFHLSLRERSGL